MLKVAVRMQAGVADFGEFLADVRALDAAGAHTVWLDSEGLDPGVLLGAMAAVTAQVRLASEEPAADGPAGETLRRLSRDRVVTGRSLGEGWVAIPVPRSREAWSAALHEHETAGATGIVVPWDARLIDLLRNPEPDDRSDLSMSTG